MDSSAQTKIDIQYADNHVRFLICDCSIEKHYALDAIDRNQIKDFRNRLRTIESLTWKQFGALPRDKGITSEVPGTDSFNMIDNEATYERNLIEKYFFHFRIKDGDLFRVFGYQHGRYFCITHLDVKGRIHH